MGKDKLEKIPFCGPAYEHRSANISAQQSVNIYPELADDGETILAMIKAPGKEFFADFGASPIRGLHVASDKTKAWAVHYNEFIEFQNDGTWTVKGYLSTNSGIVYISDNGSHVLVVDGSATGYVYTMATGAWDNDLAVTDTDFDGGDSNCFVDGYFFVNQPDTSIIQSCTAPNGTIPTSWDALDVYSCQGIGKLVRVAEKKDGLLWAWGTFGTKVFENTGNFTGFPFTENKSLTMPVGLAARASLAHVDGSFFALANTEKGGKFIIRTQGFQFQRISTFSIEQAIAAYSSVDDAEGFTYIKDGHTFYQITFPTGNKTFVYDLSTGMWHERESKEVGKDRARFCVFFIGEHIIGDSVTGRLGKLKNDVYKEYDKEMVWKRRTQHFRNDGQGFICHELIVDMLTGIGINEMRDELVPADGSIIADGSYYAGARPTLTDPQIMLRVSKDEGRSWSSERWCGAGKLGEFTTRVRFLGLGMARHSMVFEISGSDNVQIAIRGGMARMEGLRS